jgi:hypothetical protein
MPQARYFRFQPGNIMNPGNSRRLAVAIGVVGALYGLNWLITPIFVKPTTLEVAFRQRCREPLNSVSWKAGKLGIERYGMAHFVMHHALLSNAGSNEVQSVLGVPSFKQRYPTQRQIGWVYRLAKQRDVPAKTSLLWPTMAGNYEEWALEVLMDAEERGVAYTRIIVL